MALGAAAARATLGGGGLVKEILLNDEVFRHADLPLQISRVPVGHQVPAHGHEFQEMVYVERGRATHEVGLSGPGLDPARRRRYPLLPGDCFLVAPGEHHAFTEARGLVVWNILYLPAIFGADAAALRGIPSLREFLFVEPLFRHENRTMAKLHLGVDERAGVLANLQACLRESSDQQDGWKTVTRARFLVLLVALARAWSHQRTTPGSGTGTTADSASGQAQAVAAAVGFMEEHYGQELSLRAIADQALLSPHHFSEVFKRHCGMPPWDFLLHLRLQRAKDLLTTTSDSVTRIALEVGFSDSSYFARVFKAQTGMTPRAWRDQALKPERNPVP